MNKFFVVAAVMFSSALSGCATSGSYAEVETFNSLDSYVRMEQANRQSVPEQNLLANLDLAACLNKDPSVQELAEKNVTSFSSGGSINKDSAGNSSIQYKVTYTQDGTEKSLPLPFVAQANAFWDGSSFVITPKTSEHSSNVCANGVAVAKYLNTRV